MFSGAARGVTAAACVLVLMSCGENTRGATTGVASIPASPPATTSPTTTALIGDPPPTTATPDTIAEQSAVPWVDDPAPSTTTTTTTTTTLPIEGSPCGADNLVPSLGFRAGASSQDMAQIVLTNTGKTTCVLDGYPTVAGVNDDGSVLAFETQHGVFNGEPWLNSPIAPGEQAALTVQDTTACWTTANGGTAWTRIELELPQAGGTLQIDLDLDSYCGIRVSRFYRPDLPAPTPATVEPSPLTATVVAPATVRAGTTLEYSVLLTNPTATDVALDPCPVYSTGITTFTGQDEDVPNMTVERLVLNCAAIATIPARTTIEFLMRLRIPADQPPGNAKFWWYVDGDAGPFWGSEIEVLTPAD